MAQFATLQDLAAFLDRLAAADEDTANNLPRDSLVRQRFKGRASAYASAADIVANATIGTSTASPFHTVVTL